MFSSTMEMKPDRPQLSPLTAMVHYNHPRSPLELLSPKMEPGRESCSPSPLSPATLLGAYGGAVKTEPLHIQMGSPSIGSPCGIVPEKSPTSPLPQTSSLHQVYSVVSRGGSNPKRMRSSENWGMMPPSPSAVSLSIDSLSPSPTFSGQVSVSTVSVNLTNGLSPLPSSQGSHHDPYSPNTKTGREDMSPLNGYGMTEMSANDLSGDRKRKGPAPRQQEELCLVCGDRASGYHYNALTCEGCKGFFRRSITKSAVYQCKYGSNCEIDMYMRRKCQECRLKKCLHVGMRPECVVPETQCIVKREAKKAQKEKDRPNSTTNGSPDYPKKSNDVTYYKPPNSTLTPEQQDLITRLVYYQNEFEKPSNEDIKRTTLYSSGSDGSVENSDAAFTHVTEMTILTVTLIVDFSKNLPGFDSLQRDDQITLLKACSSEVMMLRTARRFDLKTNSIVFADNRPFTKEMYVNADLGSDCADALFGYCRQMCITKVDNAEFALLTAIVIFSERPNLLEPWKVEKIQEIYVDALQAYIEQRRDKPSLVFAKLLTMLAELRTLGNLNSEQCFNLKLKNKKLPPLLSEIWDIYG